MKTLLTNPPWFETGHAVRAGSRWPHAEFDEKGDQTGYCPFPFFIGYTAAVLAKDGHEVKVIDALATRMGKKKFLKEVESFDPEIVIIETSTPSVNRDLETAKNIKNSLNAKIALCGPHATTFPEEILKKNKQIDFIFLGEYEYTSRETALALEKKTSLHKILGLALRENRRVIVNQRRPLLDLNELPFPARHLFDMNHYLEPFAKTPNVQLTASRGCTFGCIYCLWPPVMYNGRNYRFRNPNNIITEVRQIIKDYNPRELYFDDDTFNLVPQKVFDFCKAYKESGINKPWSAMCSTIPATREMLETMRDAGCEALKFGVESGSEEILRNVGRISENLQHVKDVFRWCKELGIRTLGTFMIGLPGDTKETINKTFELFLELEPTAYQLSIATPLPGTPFYQLAKEKGWLLAKKWEDFSYSHYIYDLPAIRTDHLSPQELKRYSEYGNTTLYMKMLAKKIISDPAFAIERIRSSFEQNGFVPTIKKVCSKGMGMIKSSFEK